MADEIVEGVRTGRVPLFRTVVLTAVPLLDFQSAGTELADVLPLCLLQFADQRSSVRSLATVMASLVLDDVSACLERLLEI